MSTPPSQNPQGFFEENDDIDFVFNFNEQLIKSPPLSAAELFDGGKIKPLKLLSRTQYRGNDSPMTPRSPKRMIAKSFIVSPRLITTKQERLVNHHHHSSTRHTGQKQSKCLSTTLTGPNVVSKLTKTRQTSVEIASLSSVSFSRSISSASTSSSTSSSNWSKRWKFLFRSASEGHATENEVYSLFTTKSHKEDSKNTSFRSENGRHLGTKDGRRLNGRVSAHEWHYKKNKEAAKERRKTFLPYKNNLLGCMDLDSGSVSEVSRWIGVEITC